MTEKGFMESRECLEGEKNCPFRHRFHDSYFTGVAGRFVSHHSVTSRILSPAEVHRTIITTSDLQDRFTSRLILSNLIIDECKVSMHRNEQRKFAIWKVFFASISYESLQKLFD
jgi:hypothetical protein